ncbi:uncharacterized protein K460DRAFT_403079 [Cucurbitaria berberidis CBS 394.84]|uniref:Uncharacterized protein n=1 Tax=Cucurbitaria berberidis CBS 394.84 TaxID=1168544 RepID=A0A9P4GLP9_9PLEO|nr:uncharacterized protein K460DRAFT_403079 [Cucurbitaria berberidis CBS 394.84]KAF1847754.1 hypothetical protein K460DRAFT_403079 [Cucurbitaria berberidis CBS 394.84]
MSGFPSPPQALTLLTSSRLQILLSASLILAILVILLSIIHTNYTKRQQYVETEQDVVSRIKRNAQTLHPKLFNIAVLLKHGPSELGGSDTWWAAAVCGFEVPFTQRLVGETGPVRLESKTAALRNLDELLQVQCDRVER